MREYYLYRHIRLDKNEPFYIGISTKILKSSSFEREFKRAFSINKRNRFWYNITNKVKFKVEIVLQSNNLKYIKSKEIDFIKLYGRRDLGLGTLYNLTDGGESNSGKIISQETRDKIRKANKGKIRSEFTKLQHSLKMKGHITSSETKLKLSVSGKGRKLTESQLKALIKRNTGRVVSLNTREKLSNFNLGRIETKEGKINRILGLQKRIVKMDINNNIIKQYNVVNDILNDHPDFNINSIRKACQKILKTYKNLYGNIYRIKCN